MIFTNYVNLPYKTFACTLQDVILNITFVYLLCFRQYLVSTEEDDPLLFPNTYLSEL